MIISTLIMMAFKNEDRGIYLALGIILLLSIVLGYQAITMTNKSDQDRNYSNSTSQKGKCAWCGKYAELTGDFCDNCNENAFGKDGWYHDIAD